MENPEMPSSDSLSLSSRLLNVYSSPAEAFDGITSAPSKGKFWVLPWLVSILIGSVFTFVIFSNPALKQQIQDAQAKAIQERVEKGEMTQQQADQAQSGMEQMGGLIMVFGIIGVVIVICLYFFAGALIFWLLGKFAFKSAEGYGTYLALYGTASWIGILGSLVTLLMILGFSSLHATPSLGLAVLSNYDAANIVHRILGKIDVFAAWEAVVLGFGLAKISGKPSGTAIGVTVVLWLVWALGTGALKFGT